MHCCYCIHVILLNINDVVLSFLHLFLRHYIVYSKSGQQTQTPCQYVFVILDIVICIIYLFIAGFCLYNGVQSGTIRVQCSGLAQPDRNVRDRRDISMAVILGERAVRFYALDF